MKHTTIQPRRLPETIFERNNYAHKQQFKKWNIRNKYFIHVILIVFNSNDLIISTEYNWVIKTLIEAHYFI